MPQRIPLVALSLCAFGSAGCERGASQAGTTPPTPEHTSNSTVAQIEAEPEEGPVDCRVLVNTDQQVHDVRMFADGRPAQVERARGNVMVAGERTFAVTEHAYGFNHRIRHVEVQELPSGIHEVFEPYDAGSNGDWLIDACIARHQAGTYDEGCNESYYSSSDVCVNALVGPYLALTGGTSGYTGGAHGFDDVNPSLWNLAGPKPDERSPLELVDEADQARLEEAFNESAPSNYAEEYGYGYDLTIEDDVSAGSMVIDDEGRLELEFSVGCCSWNYNHGHFEFYVTLEAPPDSVAAHLPDPETQRWVQEGCGSVDLDGVVRDEAGRELALIDEEPIGVYWIDVDHDLQLSAIPKTEDIEHELPDELEGEKPGSLGRRLMKAGRYDHAAAAFEAAYRDNEDARWLGELCWAEFKLGNLEQAEHVCLDALQGAPDLHSLAAMIYNLGRVAEARGDLDEAIVRYEKSLALRPNATVESRLAQVRARERSPGG